MSLLPGGRKQVGANVVDLLDDGALANSMAP